MNDYSTMHSILLVLVFASFGYTFKTYSDMRGQRESDIRLVADAISKLTERIDSIYQLLVEIEKDNHERKL